MSQKSAFLFHGTNGSSTDYFWFADTKTFLEDHGYSVWWPALPNTERPELAESLDFILANMPAVTEETIIIGHSAGCPLAFCLLPLLPMPIRQALLVGGFYQPLGEDDPSSLMLPESFDWAGIRSKATEIVFINSDNDPWGCGDQQAREPAIQLGASLVVPTGQGHMGSTAHNQPYREFPLLKRLLLVL